MTNGQTQPRSTAPQASGEKWIKSVHQRALIHADTIISYPNVVIGKEEMAGFVTILTPSTDQVELTAVCASAGFALISTT
jgi:hypothetical protein